MATRSIARTASPWRRGRMCASSTTACSSVSPRARGAPPRARCSSARSPRAISVKVADQGAPGAYSESAAATMFPDEERVAERTFADVFAALSSNAVRAAVVPVENTLAGSVVDVYDLLRTHDDLTVLGEVAIPIRHCLLVVPGTRIDEVRVARSHAHAIAQVEDYLRANGIEAQVAYDTAGAASEVALAGDRSVAAVAARRAATTYGLEVAAEIPRRDRELHALLRDRAARRPRRRRRARAA